MRPCVAALRDTRVPHWRISCDNRSFLPRPSQLCQRHDCYMKLTAPKQPVLSFSLNRGSHPTSIHPVRPATIRLVLPRFAPALMLLAVSAFPLRASQVRHRSHRTCSVTPAACSALELEERDLRRPALSPTWAPSPRLAIPRFTDAVLARPQLPTFVRRRLHRLKLLPAETDPL
jgi:hypothetical protein